MSDLIERLRTTGVLEAEMLLDEAAAEIERLREQLAAAEADARRYRWLRDTLHTAVGGGVEVNDARLVYEAPEPEEVVRVFWYPDTPVGFYEVKAVTLDAAIDAAITEEKQ